MVKSMLLHTIHICILKCLPAVPQTGTTRYLLDETAASGLQPRLETSPALLMLGCFLLIANAVKQRQEPIRLNASLMAAIDSIQLSVVATFASGAAVTFRSALRQFLGSYSLEIMLESHPSSDHFECT